MSAGQPGALPPGLLALVGTRVCGAVSGDSQGAGACLRVCLRRGRWVRFAWCWRFVGTRVCGVVGGDSQGCRRLLAVCPRRGPWESSGCWRSLAVRLRRGPWESSGCWRSLAVRLRRGRCDAHGPGASCACVCGASVAIINGLALVRGSAARLEAMCSMGVGWSPSGAAVLRAIYQWPPVTGRRPPWGAYRFSRAAPEALNALLREVHRSAPAWTPAPGTSRRRPAPGISARHRRPASAIGVRRQPSAPGVRRRHRGWRPGPGTLPPAVRDHLTRCSLWRVDRCTDLRRPRAGLTGK
jgi:hypothetical protein